MENQNQNSSTIGTDAPTVAAPGKKKFGPKLKAGCGVLFVFGLGFVFGAVFLLIVIGGTVRKAETWKTDESKSFITNHFTKQLDLDEQQQAKFRPIVHEALEERWNLRKAYIEENQTLIREKYFPRIAEFLTEEQKEKAAELLERWQSDQAYKISLPEDTIKGP